MKTYYVSIPFTGYTTVEVEAESKEQAIEKAWNHPEMDEAHSENIEFHHHVVQGNACYALMRQIEVEEVDE